MEQVQICLFSIQVFQLFFFIFQTALYKRKEYFYYTLYVLSSILYLIGFSHVIKNVGENEFSFFFFLDKPLAFLSYFLYFKFAKHFLDIPSNNPVFAKKLNQIEITLLSFTAILVVTTSLFTAQINETIFSMFSLISVPLAFYSIIKFIQLKTNRLNYFVVIGASLMVLAAISTFLFIKTQQFLGLDTSYPVYLHYHIFIILELLVFSIGLGYKAYKMEFENAKLDRQLVLELIEKEKIQQNLTHTRNQMARDLHDDIGASISGIKILADLINRSTKDENANELSKISTQLLHDFRETTWLLTEETDTIKPLVEQIEKQWKTLLKVQGITLIIDLKNDLKISILQKKNVFLFFKEALTNSMKHANCSVINMMIEYKAGTLLIHFFDNGMYRHNQQGNGAGLNNMRERLKEIKGELIVNINKNESVKLTAKIKME